jgi:hypothetical protein
MIRADLSPLTLVAGQESDLIMRFVNRGAGTCSNVIFKLVLPRQIALVGGSDRVEIRSLPAGETTTRTVRVRPKEPGAWTATSTNFSFRDRRGHGCRVEGFAVELVVELPAPVAVPRAPELVLTLQTAHLPHREWTTMHGRVHNVGGTAARGTTVTVSGQCQVHPESRCKELRQIDPGQRVEFDCHVRAIDRGDIPVCLDVLFTDASGRPGRAKQTFTVSVGDPVARPAANGPVRVLYLAASPSDALRTQWEQGFREIQDACQRSKNAARFELTNRFGLRDRDIGQALIDVSPHVVQFSGHGLNGGLYVESVLGRREPIAADGLVSLFRVVADSVNCVILGACHTAALAKELAGHVEYAIGMAGEIDSRSMINFSIGFYQAFTGGLSVKKAFDTGLAHIGMQSYNKEDRLVPQLFVRDHRGT